MKRLLMLTVAFLLFSGFTLSWDTVTTYTDGTPINDDSVVYDAWGGATQIANGITGTSATFTAGKGVTATMKVRARLVRQGGVSDNSTLSWTSPLGLPSSPLNLRVAP
jgi:hypothetical protein